MSSLLRRSAVACATALLTLSGIGGAGAAEAPPAAAPADASASEPAGGLEATRAWVRATTLSVARTVDSWFGDRAFADGGRVEQGRLDVRTSWRRDEGYDVSVQLDTRFDLPNLRDRAYAFLGRDARRDVVVDKPAAFSQQDLVQVDPRRDESFFAGLALPLSRHVELRSGVRGGLEVYAQLRYADAWALSERLQLAFRETVFWTVDDGFGSTTSVSFNQAFSPVLAARWITAGTVSQESDGFEWSSLVGLYRRVGTDRELATEALVTGQSGSDVDVADYGLRVRWTQPVYRDWLLGEFTLGRFWPKPDAATPREGTWMLGAGLLMRF